MILNPSYFTNRKYFIPGSIAEPAAGFNTPTNEGYLTELIDRLEYEVLVSSLGQEQYDELKSYFTGDVIDPNAPAKWLDLVNGKDYDGKRWQGLRNETLKTSLIVPYVFYQYLSQEYSVVTNTGVQVAEAANAIVQSPTAKMVEAWNEFVMAYGHCHAYHNEPVFFETRSVTGVRWYHKVTHSVSLYQFLQDFPEDYDSSFFTGFGGVINQFGL